MHCLAGIVTSDVLAVAVLPSSAVMPRFATIGNRTPRTCAVFVAPPTAHLNICTTLDDVFPRPASIPELIVELGVVKCCFAIYAVSVPFLVIVLVVWPLGAAFPPLDEALIVNLGLWFGDLLAHKTLVVFTFDLLITLGIGDMFGIGPLLDLAADAVLVTLGLRVLLILRLGTLLDFAAAIIVAAATTFEFSSRVASDSSPSRLP